MKQRWKIRRKWRSWAAAVADAGPYSDEQFVWNVYTPRGSLAKGFRSWREAMDWCSK